MLGIGRVEREPDSNLEGRVMLQTGIKEVTRIRMRMEQGPGDTRGTCRWFGSSH